MRVRVGKGCMNVGGLIVLLLAWVLQGGMARAVMGRALAWRDDGGI